MIFVVLCFILLSKSVTGLLFNSCTPPQNFPATIEKALITYENWNKELKVKDIWAAYPKTAQDVVTLVNWAAQNDYKIRASGSRHSWSPLTVMNGTPQCSRIIVVDTTKYLTRMNMPANSNLVTAEVGVQMDDLLQYIEDQGYGFLSVPATGAISVGGVLAVNAHGTSIPAIGESASAGHLYGSMSNKIVNFTAVVWDDLISGYTVKSFNRADPESAAFLVNLGRAFLIEVTLMTGPDYYMRCIGRTDIKASELFANTTTANNTVSSLLDQFGRIEVTWFAFTETPWVILRSLSPTKPAESTYVTSPYNYMLTKSVPPVLSQILQLIANRAGNYTKLYAQTAFQLAKMEMLTKGDLWGKSKNLMLYIKNEATLTSGSSLVVHSRRSNLQNVLNRVYNFYNQLVEEFTNRHLFPSTFFFCTRISGLDTAPENGWSVPGISSVRPLTPNSPFDIGIWFDIETLPNSTGVSEFMERFQDFLFTTFNNENAKVTPEWSKQCAYTTAGPFTNSTVLNNILPNTFQNSWQTTVVTLNKYDPHQIFTNELLRSFFV